MYCIYNVYYNILYSLTHTHLRRDTYTGRESEWQRGRTVAVVGTTDWWPNDSVGRRRFWLMRVQLPLRDDPRDNNITRYFIFTTACIDPEGDSERSPAAVEKFWGREGKKSENHWPRNADLHVSKGLGVYVSLHVTLLTDSVSLRVYL